MALRKCGIGFILILLLVGCWRVFAAPEPPIKLIFQGEAVDPQAKAIAKNEVKYVNLQFLTLHLKVKGNWKPDTGQIQLQYGAKCFELQEDQLSFRITAETNAQTLATAPFEQEGQLWFPVEFLNYLGVRVKFEDPGSLELGWAEDYLLSVENTTYQGRPALVLIGTKPLKFTSSLVNNPDRLIIDLAGLKIHPALDTSGVENAWVHQVRYGQYNSQTSRVVIDLTRLGGYRLMLEPGHNNRLIVVFNYTLQTVKLVERDGEQKIQIQTDEPPIYQVQQLTKPSRIVIDFEGATLQTDLSKVLGNGKWFKQVRISQFDLFHARVVVDLVDPNGLFKIICPPDNPRVLEIRSVQAVKAVQWQESTPKWGTLTLDGIEDPGLTIYKLKKPSRLLIDLDLYRFQSGVKAPSVPENSCIKGIHLSTLSATRAQIEVDLKYYAGYETRFDAEMHRFTVSLIKSPLVGTTIVLDAGHGGNDMGATGGLGTLEKQVNLDVTMRLKELLQDAGSKVLLTRHSDEFIGLYERALVANRFGAGVFISIHSNFHPDPTTRGFEIYHYKGLEASDLLARQIETKMIQTTHLSDLGVKTNDFVVIRETLMPSVLVELGYLSNKQEELQMKTTVFRDNAAWGIMSGIVEYYYL